MNTIDVQDLRTWLESLGAEDCADALEAADVDMEVMRELTEEDLRELGLNLGQRKRVLRGIAALDETAPPPPKPVEKPKPKPSAERRQLSFVFCDLVNSTGLANEQDAEDMATILQTYHGICASVAERWGGRMLQQYGDGCLLLFGHPNAHEDDPVRAVRTGLEVVAEINAAQPVPGVSLQTRVAIATGRVVIGDLQGGQDPDAVAGETPNLAARLQNIAEPGNVVIAPTTRRLVGGAFDVDSLGDFDLKGFADPVEVWKVLGEAEEDVSDTGSADQLIGREAEMAVLRESWAKVLSGKPQIVSIQGEPGIGKSWLTSSFAQEALRSHPDAHRVRNFCVAFKTNSALHPFLTSIARLAGIKGKDGPSDVRRKLAICPAVSAATTPDAAALLAAQFGAEDPKNPIEMNAAQQKLAMFGLLVEMLSIEASKGPLLLEIEDTHWADPTTLELMRHVAAELPELPVLILATQRPGYEVGWQDAPWIAKIDLQRLPLQASLEIAQHAMGGQGLSEARLRDIVAKADGVPLFVEELTRSAVVMDSSAVGGSLEVPDTLEDSLMARLSLLGEAKSVAQIAATIGRRFNLAILDALNEVTGVALDTAIDRLVAADIVFPAEDGTPDAYVFSHALIQDAAYASLLRRQRKDLHARIATILSDETQQSALIEPEILARHYAGAEMPIEAVMKLIEAGQRATARAAQIEANNHLRAALELLTTAPKGEDTTRLEASVNAMLGQSLLATVGFAAPDVGEAFERARQQSAEISDTPLLLSSLYGVWVVAASRGEREKALHLAAEALELFGESDVPLFAMGAHFMDGVTQIYIGELERAEAAFERTLSYYTPEMHPLCVQAFGDDFGSFTLIYMLWIYALRGDFAASLAFTERNQELTEQLGDKQIETRTLGFTMSGMQMVGEVEAANALADQLLARATELCYPYWISVGQVGRGWVLSQTGKVEEGLEQFQAALGFLDAIGQRTPLSLLQSYYAESLIAAGQNDNALAMLNGAIETCQTALDSLYLPDLIRLRGLCQAETNPAAAEAEIRRAMSEASARGMGYFTLRAAFSLRQLLDGTENEAEATTLLQDARAACVTPVPFAFVRAVDALLGTDAAE